MNFEEMSDFEINEAVAGHVSDCFAMKMKDGSSKFNYIEMEQDEEFNPCNNPADAWPIIVENNICIHQGEFPVAFLLNDYWESRKEAMNKNPLRAAMIVFLKMKEAEK